MSNTNAEDKANLNDLKDKLWKKILVLEKTLPLHDETSDEYRKTLDAYHKLVKAYLDVIKVQRYAPGLVGDDGNNNELSHLFDKARAGKPLEPEEKRSLLQFKRYMDAADSNEGSMIDGGEHLVSEIIKKIRIGEEGAQQA
jgi:hypothetical protein